MTIIAALVSVAVSPAVSPAASPAGTEDLLAFRAMGDDTLQQVQPSQTAEQKAYKKKKVFLAFLMSTRIPSSGQFYNGQYSKGALGLAVMASGLIIYAMGNEEDDKAELGDPGLLLVAGTWMWSMIDAPISAHKINQEAEGQKMIPMGYAPEPGWDVYTALSPSKRSAHAGVLLRF